MVCYVAYNTKTKQLVGVYRELPHAKSRVSQLTGGEWLHNELLHRWTKGVYRIQQVTLGHDS